MDDLVVASLERRLAARPSRRGFLRMLGGIALGVALALNGASLAFASHGCCHCPPTPCPCYLCLSPCHVCGSMGCSTSCINYGSWQCCEGGCLFYCAECVCFDPFDGSQYCCHCKVNTGTSCGGNCIPPRPDRSREVPANAPTAKK